MVWKIFCTFPTLFPLGVANHMAVLFPYPALCDFWCLLIFYFHCTLCTTNFLPFFALLFHWFTDFLSFFALLFHWLTEFLHLIFLFVALSDASCGYVGRAFWKGDGWPDVSLEDQVRGVRQSPHHGGRFSCSSGAVRGIQRSDGRPDGGPPGGQVRGNWQSPRRGRIWNKGRGMGLFN